MADKDIPTEQVWVSFEVWSPPPPSDFRIIVTGSIPALGNWFTENPISMELQGEGVWRLQLALSSSEHFEYKYACYSNKEGRCVGYEQGPNRQLSLPQKLQQDHTIDEETGLKKVSVKDVWSAVQPQQPVAAYNNVAPQGRNAYAGGMVQQQPYAGGQGYSQSQYSGGGGYAGGQANYGQRAVSHYGAYPNNVGTQAAAESAANYIQQQIMNDRNPKQGNDTQLNARLTKVVGEVSGLKKKLKESQRDQRDMMKTAKELEERYELKLKDKAAQIRALEHELELVKQQKDQIQSKALEDGKSAAAAEAAESLARELERHRSIQSALERENQQLKKVVEDTRAETSASQEEAGKVRVVQEEMSQQLKARETELSLLESVVSEFGKGVEDRGVSADVTNSDVPLQERLGNLLLHLEAQSNRKDTTVFDGLLAQCQEMREEFAVQKKAIRRDVEKHVADVARLAEQQLTEFLRDQEHEKQVYIERYNKQFNERKQLANEIVDLKGKIRVFGRARPFISREKKNGHANVLAFPEANRLLIGADAERFMLANDVEEGQQTEMGQNKMEDVKTYELDHIFAPTASQEDVFEEVRHLVGSVLDGYNVTVFAYGQTGSGKTHTMDGTPENPGITYRSLGLFFKDAQQAGKRKGVSQNAKVEVEISMLEIYNEEIRDLLDAEAKAKLDVRQAADGGSYVAGLSKMHATSLSDALEIMELGRQNRKTASTNMNATSSRSHMVFTCYVTVTHATTGDKTTSKLHLVDLAGSERVAKTGASGDQLKEAMFINKSLSALGDVISALTANSDKGHVPYRNSKLTFLLQDSLCGNARTAMFVALSPSSDNYWETISTLNFGARAASVELGQVQKNFESGELGQLREQLNRLQDQLVEQKGSAGGAAETIMTLRDRTAELEKQVDLKDRKFKTLQARNEELTEELSRTESSTTKKQDKLRSEIKAREERIKELEDQVKKGRKDVLGAQKGQASELEAVTRELNLARKQCNELEKSLKVVENKIQASESRAKKADQKAAKAEEEVKQAREALSKQKARAKSDLDALRKEHEAASSARPERPPSFRPQRESQQRLQMRNPVRSPRLANQSPRNVSPRNASPRNTSPRNTPPTMSPHKDSSSNGLGPPQSPRKRSPRIGGAVVSSGMDTDDTSSSTTDADPTN